MSNESEELRKYEALLDEIGLMLMHSGIKGDTVSMRVHYLLEERKALIQGLKDVINPVGKLEREMPQGCVLNGGMLFEILKSPNTYISIARDALNKCE
jgi:hypothetical protein